MRFTLITKNGSVGVNTENPGKEIFKSNSPIFKAVENAFDWWIANQATTDAKQMYFGSFDEMDGGSYLSRQGAIKDGIWEVIQWAEDNQKPVFNTTAFFTQIDLAAAFEA